MPRRACSSASRPIGSFWLVQLALDLRRSKLQRDLDTPIARPILGTRVRDNRVGFAAAFGAQASALRHILLEQFLHCLGSRLREVDVRLEPSGVDPRIVGKSPYNNVAADGIERGSNAFQRRQE